MRVTEAALLTLRDEEIPQRIGFVSDKIFEPSPGRALVAGILGIGGPGRVRLRRDASGAPLWFTRSARLRRHGSRSRSGRPRRPTPELAASFERRLQEAVRAAVAESEARQDRKTAALLAAAEQRHQLDFKAVQLAAEENLDMMRKRFNVRYRASADFGDTQ